MEIIRVFARFLRSKDYLFPVLGYELYPTLIAEVPRSVDDDYAVLFADNEVIYDSGEC